MVDTVNLVFPEAFQNGIVDFVKGFQVVADGFFQHHPGVIRDQPGVFQVLADGAEDIGRGGEIKHAHGTGLVFQRFFQPCVMLGCFCIYLLVKQALFQTLPVLCVEILGGDEVLAGAADALQMLLTGHFRATQQKHPALRMELLVFEAVIQRGDDFAQRKIACAAENHNIRGA